MMVFPDFRFSGSPKLEIKKKSQKNFQTNFVRLILEHREAAETKGRSSEVTRGLALLGCFYELGTKPSCRKGRLSLQVMSLSDHARSCTARQDGGLLITAPAGRSYSGQTLVTCACGIVVWI